MLKNVHTQGVERLENYIAQFPEWRRLTSAELKGYASMFVAGWELPGLCKDQATHLRVLIDSKFPFKPPRVAVFPAPPILAFPNLEELGILCLVPETSSEHIEAITLNLLQGAQELVNEWHSGGGKERFEDEFESYWNRWERNKEQFVSLCATGGATRWVFAFHEKQFTIVADEEQTLKSWVSNYYTPGSKVVIQRIPLIALPRPPRPDEYPSTVQELFAMVGKDSVAMSMLQELINSNPDKRKGVLLSFPGRIGSGFAGLILPSNDKKAGNGFRKHKGHICSQMLMQRYNVKQINGASVTRCDTSWIHGRDHNADVATLNNKTVILLGAGSLGSGVAELVAKMGVKKLILVDPEMLESENSSRHSLGVRSMSHKKASALALNLSKRFPHLQFEPHDQRWEDCYIKHPELFASADLIISTIGVWSAESNLNTLAHTSQDFPPVLFGWLEEHAVAGHAVIFREEKGCLRCMTDAWGLARIPVTKWSDGGTLKQIPMCGGVFQPYGAVELSFSQGLVADLAADILLGTVKDSAHRVWIGQQKLLEPGKGEWNPAWIELHGHPENGGRIVNIDITNAPCCPVCGEPQ